MTALVRYDAARKALAEAKSIDEVKHIRDKAIAMAAYARQANDKGMEADAAEIRMRATRRLGQMMKQQKATVGLAKGHRFTGGSIIDPPVIIPTLAEVGIDKHLAHDARQLSDFEDEEFEEVVSETRVAVTEAAKNVVRRRTKESRREERLKELGDAVWPTGLFSIFNADPPWPFDTWSDKGMDRSAENHYPTMTLDEIIALDVASIAANPSFMTMWVTVPHLENAFTKVLPAWGFDYKCLLTWDKVDAGTGYWMRNQTEHLVFATKGNFPLPPEKLRLSSLWREKSGVHSAKPVGILDWIDAAYPGLPKTELFRRGPPRPGWVAHGNQVKY